MPALQSADLALASGLRLSVMRLARRLRNQRTDSSLSLTQLAVLATLERHGPMSPGELAAHERVQPPSMTRVLAALEERDLVVRRPHATDRRQAVVEVRSAGLAILKADRRMREAWLAQRLPELSAEERAALRAAVPVLERLAAW